MRAGASALRATSGSDGRCAAQAARRHGDSGRGWRNPSRDRCPAGSLRRMLDHAHASRRRRASPCRQKAQAADAVADRHLVGRLLLASICTAARRWSRSRPAAAPARSAACASAGPLPLQPARQLGDERAGHRRLGARHVGDAEDHALGIVSAISVMLSAHLAARSR